MIKTGELILLYGGERAQYLLEYKPNKRFSTHLGDIIIPEKADYGDPVKSTKDKIFYILKPTTVDLMMKVKRTTTIVYPKDAGLMIVESGIGAGSRVVEVGTGSGALTILLSRIVGREGHVYTYERREEFLKNAIENIRRSTPFDNVTFSLKDPAIEGFGITDVDATFIDVPEPWTLKEAAHECLKGGGVWISLSPTIDQILRTKEALIDKFTAIRCVEVLERPYLIRPGKTRPVERMVSHTAYLLFARKIYPPNS